MADLRQMVPSITRWIHDHDCETQYNHDLFDIIEGNLLTHIKADFQRELAKGSFNTIEPRIVPINILKRIINKLSKVYAIAPTRSASTENETDQELLEWYEEQFRVNTIMGEANKFFNLFKNTAIEPFLDNGKPGLRTVPSDQFLPFTKSKINPMKMQAFIKFLGVSNDQDFTQFDRKGTDQREVNEYAVFSDNQFLVMNDDGVFLPNHALMFDNPEGINPFGKIPFVYINRSRHHLVPYIDSDTLAMSKNIPKLYTDLVYATMFQSFSLIYGVNAKLPDKPIMSPNAIWEIQPVDPTLPTQIESLKPSVDIDKTIQLIQNLTSDWLESRGLRPGAVKGGPDNAMSGVAMMIQNMDTTEDRQEQIEYFREAERDLWDLVAHHMHPLWVQAGMIEERRLFSSDFEVNIEYAEPRAFKDKNQIIDEQMKLLDAGLQLKEKALLEIFDDMTQEEVQEMLEKIQEEKRGSLAAFGGGLLNLQASEEEENEEEEEVDGEVAESSDSDQE